MLVRGPKPVSARSLTPVSSYLLPVVMASRSNVQAMHHLRLQASLDDFAAGLRPSQYSLAHPPPIHALQRREQRHGRVGRSARIRLDMQLHRRHICTI